MKKIAVVGVLEGIGREILNILQEGGFPADCVIALEPHSPLGNLVSYGEDDELDIYNLDEFDFSKTDAVVFASSAEISRRYIAKAAAKKTVVVDCGGAMIDDADVPMIVSGVNDKDIGRAVKNIVSVPSALVTQMLLPLAKVNSENPVTHITASSYMSTSFYGKDAMDELFNQTRKIFMNAPLTDDEKVFKKQVAFNVLPQAGEFIGEETRFEWELNAQTKKILGGKVRVHANCAFVPAFIGSALFVNVECAHDVDVEHVRKLMRSTENVVVFDKQTEGGYVSLNDIQGEDSIYVSRLRQDTSVENGFSFWCVADNLRAGTALNACNVLKLMLDR